MELLNVGDMLVRIAFTPNGHVNLIGVITQVITNEDKIEGYRTSTYYMVEWASENVEEHYTILDRQFANLYRRNYLKLKEDGAI